jgi:hypothetical protein
MIRSIITHMELVKAAVLQEEEGKNKLARLLGSQSMPSTSRQCRIYYTVFALLAPLVSRWASHILARASVLCLALTPCVR